MTILSAVFIGVSRSQRIDHPSLHPSIDPAGADFTLDAYADLETGARLIGERAGQQLRQIVSCGSNTIPGGQAGRNVQTIRCL